MFTALCYNILYCTELNSIAVMFKHGPVTFPVFLFFYINFTGTSGKNGHRHVHEVVSIYANHLILSFFRRNFSPLSFQNISVIIIIGHLIRV